MRAKVIDNKISSHCFEIGSTVVVSRRYKFVQSRKCYYCRKVFLWFFKYGYEQILDEQELFFLS